MEPDPTPTVCCHWTNKNSSARSPASIVASYFSTFRLIPCVPFRLFTVVRRRKLAMNRFWSTILTISLNISRVSSSMSTKIANQPLLWFVQLYVSLLSFLANGCCNYPVSTISTIRFNISLWFVGRSLVLSPLFLTFFLMPSFLFPCGGCYLVELFLFY